MQEAGWDLLLVARKPTLDIARIAGLKGAVHVLSLSPYSKSARTLRNPFADVIAAIHTHQPELVFFAPSQPSFLEEELAGRLKNIRLGGFVLKERFWPGECLSNPIDIAKNYHLQIPVQNQESEPERNQKASHSLLGRTNTLQPFQFSQSSKMAFRSRWKDSANPGDHVVVSPGYRKGDYFKGLGVNSWVRELRGLESEIEERFIFTGSQSEAESNHEIFQRLQKRHHADLTGQLLEIEDLLAVLEAGKGYVGKDSGSMHLAAALGKPVLGVFGGGHWPRFLPVGTKACILTVSVPCRGCDWRCHLPEPLCVTDLPAGAVLEGWNTLKNLPDGHQKTMEYLPRPASAQMLIANPGTGFTEQCHVERRKNLALQRRKALNPFLHPIAFCQELLGLHKS